MNVTSDIEIAQSASMLPIQEVAAKLGLTEDMLETYGRYKAKVDVRALQDLPRKAKLVLVTAISPTPAGEGKTTTSVGLADALNRIGKRTVVCLREPSLGPVFGVKGGVLMILQDPMLTQETIKIIEQEKYNAAYATEMGFNSIIQMFEEMEDPYMAARSRDIADMKKKVLAKILHKEEINLLELPKNTILVTKELTTSDTAKLDLKNIAGIVTEIGGVNSHMFYM